MTNLASLNQFLMSLDGLKWVERRNYLQQGQRRENSAEHSWHLAMAVWALASFLNWDVDMEKLLKLALIHDLGEMEAGDTFLYAADRHLAAAREYSAIQSFSQQYSGFTPQLESLWLEQQNGSSIEARLLKIADRFLPFLHNLHSDGKAWREHGISKQQVLLANSVIAAETPEIFEWMRQQLELAVHRGWLTNESIEK